MKFVTLRDLKNFTPKILDNLRKENELILTVHGSPVAFMLPLTADNFEHTLYCVRKAQDFLKGKKQRHKADESTAALIGAVKTSKGRTRKPRQTVK
jgi:antitoxin (DNA-binding transcriptional repressor) of toxin-antitoxin stability system